MPRKPKLAMRPKTSTELRDQRVTRVEDVLKGALERLMTVETVVNDLVKRNGELVTRCNRIEVEAECRLRPGPSARAGSTCTSTSTAKRRRAASSRIALRPTTWLSRTARTACRSNGRNKCRAPGRKSGQTPTVISSRSHCSGTAAFRSGSAATR